MSPNPPRWLVACHRLAIPPICREHVLGNLHERFSERPSTLAYLRDALLTVPLVIWSQIRRGFHPTFVRAQGLVLYAGFISGAFYVHGSAASMFLVGQHGLWLLAVPTLVILIFLIIADTYTSYGEPSAPLQFGIVTLAFALAWTINLVAFYITRSWVVPASVLGWGTIVGVGCLPPMRYLWKTKRRHPVAASGVALHAPGYAHAQRLVRTTWRRTWSGSVVGLGMTVAFGWFAFAAKNSLQAIGGSLTAAACLYLIYQLRQGRPATLPLEGEVATWVPVYRAELIRQRDFHRGRQLWWRLVAMVPGYFLFLAGLVMAHPEGIGRVTMIAGAFVLFSCLSIPTNRRVAREYQDQLDTLSKDGIE